MENLKYNDYKVDIKPSGVNRLSKDKLANLKSIANELALTRLSAQKIKNEMLAIRYQMESYADNNCSEEGQICTLEMFVEQFLQVLKLTKKRFALALNTTDGNLKKYLLGERKFNIDLAMKFGHFFHTPPDLWLNIQAKNDLILLSSNKDSYKKYAQYDYELFSMVAEP
ncbi:MAG: transcriptional regulator [Sphingobacteriales bacterium]|nr:MAG: transcriptional regulator [Sphingobacteriales bacterium]